MVANRLRKTSEYIKLRKTAETILKKNKNVYKQNKNIYSDQTKKLTPFKNTKKNKTSIADSATLIRELQIHQIELELQNEALTQSKCELETLLSHYSDLYDSAVLGYATFDKKGTILEANLKTAELLQTDRKTLIGKSFLDFITKKDKSFFNEQLQNALIPNTKIKFEINVYNKEQPLMRMIIKTLNSNHEECRVILQDMTDLLKEQKRALEHQRKLTKAMNKKSLSELSTEIAHEICQPLSVIQNYVNGCVNRLKNNSHTIEDFYAIMQGVTKQVQLIGDIMHHMRGIISHDVAGRQLTYLNHIAEKAAKQIQIETNSYSNLEFELSLAHHLPLVKIEPIHIELVLLNLLRNSVEALLEGNTVRPLVRLSTRYENNKIVVRVFNNGPSFLEGQEEKLFMSRFTTKKNGMGLGLPISRSIIEAHGGKLTAHQSEEGVCFQFYLPVDDEL